MSHSVPMSRPGVGALPPSLIDGLIDSLTTERRLIDELTATMLRQRGAVAAEDLQGVDDSVFAVQRILFTLGEARKKRRTIQARLGYSEDLALRDLIEQLGPLATPPLRAARDYLQSAARTLAREVTINRQVLRESIATGDAWVRALSEATSQRIGYGEGVTPGDGPTQSIIVDRQV